MHEGLLGFFKLVGPLLRLLKLLTLQKQFKQFSLTSEFKSSMIRELHNSSDIHLDPCSKVMMVGDIIFVWVIRTAE